MHDPIWLTWLSVAILVVTMMFIMVFAFEPWWRSTFGQSVMALAVAVALFSLLSVLRQALGPEYAGREQILATARILTLVAISQRLYVLVRTRLRRRSS